MGNLQASEMAGSDLPLRLQLYWHLTSNHYPPHPPYMVGVAMAAITLLLEGKGNEPIQLPEGVLWRGQRNYCTAYEAVESLHLWAWIEEGDEDDE